MAVNLVARNPRTNTRRDPTPPSRPRPTYSMDQVVAQRPSLPPPPPRRPAPVTATRPATSGRDLSANPFSFEELQAAAQLANNLRSPQTSRGLSDLFARPVVPPVALVGPEEDYYRAVADRLSAPSTPSGGAGGVGGGAGAGSGSGAAGGGARADTLARATAALEEQLAGLGGIYGDRLSGIESMYGSQLGELAGTFGGYRDSLTQLANVNRGQINDATSQALARLAELDPQAAFQWAVGEAGTPGVAGSEYLSAIGANSAEVDAVRMLSDQLMRQQLSAAQQYSMGAQSSMDRERQARQAASGLMSQEALNALAQTEQMRGTQISDEETRRRQAMESAMRQEMAAVEAERVQREQALRDQLLRYQLEYDLGV